jgi:two-component system, OmpR family, sensor kinase
VAVIDVIDDGPGIAPDEAERVFDRFVRLDTARRGTGSGLGLPIARAVARGHGGDLRYVINPGGAHFRLTMPIMSRATPSSTGSTPSPLSRTSSR